MSDIQIYIKNNRDELFETISKSISEYVYRNSRYDVDFSLVAVYCENSFTDYNATKSQDSFLRIYLPTTA